MACLYSVHVVITNTSNFSRLWGLQFFFFFAHFFDSDYSVVYTLVVDRLSEFPDSRLLNLNSIDMITIVIVYFE